jgi:hypothetical protein
VRVARALAELPAISNELRRGRLSFCKVRALTRVATPELEAELIELAKNCTGAQLESICRLYPGTRGTRDQQCSPVERADAERELQYRRQLRVQYTHSGTVVLRVELPADEAHRLVRKLEAVQAGLGDASNEPSAETPQLVDALVHVIEGGEGAREQVQVQVQVQLHASIADLREDSVAPVASKSPAHLDYHVYEVDRWLHEGGCTIEAVEGGGFRFLDARGLEIVGATRRLGLVGDGAAMLAERQLASGVDVSAGAPVCGWDGERVDKDYIIEGLMRRETAPTYSVAL